MNLQLVIAGLPDVWVYIRARIPLVRPLMHAPEPSGSRGESGDLTTRYRFPLTSKSRCTDRTNTKPSTLRPPNPQETAARFAGPASKVAPTMWRPGHLQLPNYHLSDRLPALSIKGLLIRSYNKFCFGSQWHPSVQAVLMDEATVAKRVKARY